MPTTIDHFDLLTEKGIKVIPLRENSKAPMSKGWNKEWDRKKCREQLRRFPDANIGILLGDVIDVEGDSDYADKCIWEMIGDYPHPSYKSKRGTHHLFATPDKELSILKVNDIEFRGSGHQSVLPPSQHNGIQYLWTDAFKLPVPKMPTDLFIFYEKQRRDLDKLLKPGHMKCWCGSCGKEVLLHKRRWELEFGVFQILGSKWLGHCCRTWDLRPACRLFRVGAPESVIAAAVSEV